SSAFITVLLRFRVDQMRREYIQGRFTGQFSPSIILDSLNRDLLDSGLDKHITLFLGLLNCRDKSLTFSVAGHHPLPILYREGLARFIKPTKSSFPVGLSADAQYFEETVPFDEFSSLTLFSDGILEILKDDT